MSRNLFRISPLLSFVVRIGCLCFSRESYYTEKVVTFDVSIEITILMATCFLLGEEFLKFVSLYAPSLFFAS